jgi:hypothetical protein
MKYTLLLVFAMVISKCTFSQNLFSDSNLLPWCIVPFDSQQRTPEQRIEMLKKMGMKQYAYDWREKNIPTFEREIDLAQQHNIKMEAVWMWIGNETDKIGELSKENEQVLSILQHKKLETTIWLGFNNDFFSNLSHDEKRTKGVAFLNFFAKKAKAINCKIALYNHGDWFGEPENQIEIIKASKLKDVGIVYSFHHAHHQVNRFHSMLKNMLPYLVTVNLNGMGETKIMDIGKGRYEKEMIDMLSSSGYKGRVGILGHIEEEDVELVLKRNIAGLRNLGF